MASSKNRGGRPLKFKSVAELQKKIDAYFESCWTQKTDMFGYLLFEKVRGKKGQEPKPIMVQIKPYTITALAVALNTSRETLLDYEERDAFSDTIKAAKEKCHSYAEDSLFIGKNPSGAMFSLKNNYNWADKQEVIHSGLTLADLLAKNKERKNSGSAAGTARSH